MVEGKLTEEQKRKLEEGRKRSRKERAEAEQAINNNPQFTNPRFWKNIDFDLLLQIKKAVTKGEELAKPKKVSKLKQQRQQINEELKDLGEE